ncbi:MAG: GNAT family N-acetyltransferase [Hyphomicrobiaceae bacterium]|nr:GNAT family N-acetyltransferase [Hyphomicrobiaceae bacterium]
MTNTAVTIREALDDDLPAILDLYAQPGVDDGDRLALDEALVILKRMAAYPYYKLFAVEQDGAIVATYTLLVMENLAHMGTPSAIVEQVMVAPERQGSGLGRIMMEHALGIARARGCYKLALSSNVKREAAHAFYDALGFERHGVSFRVLL